MTYLRYREKIGRYVPFPPPMHSPKDSSGKLSLKQHAHLLGWRLALRLWPETIGYVSKRPIFPIGCHNSGTTILAFLIGQHPEIINWSEAPEVWTPDNEFLNWEVMDNPPLPQPFLFDMDAYVRTVEKHGHHLSLIRNVFTMFAISRLKTRFLNKNPHMAISIPYIEAAFPDAFYVHICRNGYAVVQSLVSNWRPVLQNPQAGWVKLRSAIDPIYFEDPLAIVRLCARYWREMDARALAVLETLPPERVYYTTYEALCENPEAILREIFARFDLDSNRYDWKQLRHPTKYPWNENLPMENRNFKYRERLTREEIDAITDEVGDVLEKYGYLDKG